MMVELTVQNYFAVIYHLFHYRNVHPLQNFIKNFVLGNFFSSTDCAKSCVSNDFFNTCQV